MLDYFYQMIFIKENTNNIKPFRNKYNGVIWIYIEKADDVISIKVLKNITLN